MNKFNKFFADHGIKILVVLVLLTYFKSCGIDSEVERIKKEQRILTEEVDTLSSQIVNEEEMIFLEQLRKCILNSTYILIQNFE